jgi:hypothetical protein
MERRPAVGETYRHFKNKNYKIIAIAHHSETGEELVIYQALYGDGMVCARPLDMFVSEVDHEKYPEVTQKYRFEKIVDAGTEEKVTHEKRPEDMDVTEKMMLFFDTDDWETRYRLLLTMREEITDTIIDNLAVAIDVTIPDGELYSRYDDLRRAIQTKQRYELNARR